jgi:hypothetical protein
MKCGIQLPDAAAFCLKCGASQIEGVTTNQNRVRWEECELIFFVDKIPWFQSKNTVHLSAVAIGPQGKYIVATSEPIRVVTDLRAQQGMSTSVHSSQTEAVRVVDEMVEKLVNDGWDRYGNYGNMWFEMRFRRPVK